MMLHLHRLHIAVSVLVVALSTKHTDAVKARWITIKNPTDYLNLSQIAVYDKNENNVALGSLGATCTASQGFTWTDGRGTSQCEWAIDGVMTVRGDPDIYYHSYHDVNVEFKLDLGRTIDIDRVVVYNRARDWDDCCSARLQSANMKIQWKKVKKYMGVTVSSTMVTTYQSGLNDSLAQTHYMPDSVTNAPIVEVPPTPVCGDLTGDAQDWCFEINQYVCNKLPHLSDSKRICKMLTPRLLAMSYEELKALWSAVKDNAVELWDMFKAGNLSHFNVFRFIDKVLVDAGASWSNGSPAALGNVITELNARKTQAQQDLAAVGHSIQWTARNISLLFDVIAEFVLGLGGGLHGGGYSGHRSKEECYRCADTFEMISELVSLEDPCAQTFTAATYGALSAMWTTQGYITSTWDVHEYTRCSVYKSFYCTQDVSCYDWSDYQ